ncbi:response regulator [Hymenobacter humi]|uniref:Response regulator n=1 Tax=Hymenobacter humi TaxID=1411620 RepID=A0ABW2UEM9_9BACT
MPNLPRILLVDDDYTSNFLNAKLLQHLDPAVQVLTALNGQEALDVLRTHCQPPTPGCPALVFLDINMPVMNGFEFLEAYQHLRGAQPQDVVIVVLTTSVSPRDMARIHDLPINGFLSKPLTEEKIAQVLADNF